jgi:hypothetical protein
VGRKNCEFILVVVYDLSGFLDTLFMLKLSKFTMQVLFFRLVFNFPLSHDHGRHFHLGIFYPFLKYLVLSHVGTFDCLPKSIGFYCTSGIYCLDKNFTSEPIEELSLISKHLFVIKFYH